MRISDWSSDVCSSDLKDVDYIRIEGLEVKSGYHGVSVIGSKGSELIDLEVHGNARDGILLKDSDGVLIQGGASYDNGTVGAAKDGTTRGHGALVNSGTSNTTAAAKKPYKTAPKREQ